MASTFVIKSDSYDGRYLQLSCTQAMNMADNSSTIHWTLYSIGGDDNYYSTGPTSVKINGTEVYVKTRVAWDLRIFPAAKGQVSGTITVPHNEDGNKTITVSLSTAIYYSVVKTKTDSWELNTITRLAYLTSATENFTDTQLPTITYVNPSGNSVTALEACIADSSGNVYAPYRALSKTGTSYTFTAEDMTILKKKAENTLYLKFVIRTVVGGVTYYSSLPTTFTMTNNDDTRPVVSFTLSPDNASLPSSLASIYIQGKSRVKATITPQFKYGATASNYTLFVGGVPKISTDATITSDVITSSGDVSVTASVKDSRGFTGTATKSIKVYAYSKPTVEPLNSEKAIKCHRSDEQGNPKSSSEMVCIKARRSYYGLDGKNLCELQWRKKESSEVWNDSSHEWVDLIARTTTNTNEFSGIIKKDGVAIVFENTKSYSIQIRAKDDVGEFGIKEFDIPTESVALHLGEGGKNVSIGEYCDYAEAYTFRSAWKSIFDNGIYANHIGSIGLYNGKDFNDLYEVTGYYVSDSSPSTVGCLNYPTANTGVLEVISARFIYETTQKPWGFAYQTYRDYTGAIYTRCYYSSVGWSAWKTIT